MLKTCLEATTKIFDKKHKGQAAYENVSMAEGPPRQRTLISAKSWAKNKVAIVVRSKDIQQWSDNAQPAQTLPSCPHTARPLLSWACRLTEQLRSLPGTAVAQGATAEERGTSKSRCWHLLDFEIGYCRKLDNWQQTCKWAPEQRGQSPHLKLLLLPGRIEPGKKVCNYYCGAVLDFIWLLCRQKPARNAAALDRKFLTLPMGVFVGYLRCSAFDCNFLPWL